MSQLQSAFLCHLLMLHSRFTAWDLCHDATYLSIEFNAKL